MSNTSSNARSPVYFLSHGGPNLMEDYDHPAYQKLQEIGREITTQVKPKAIVVFSAHWQADRDAVEVNTAEHPDLIYDFYGFPPHFYDFQFPHRGSPALAQRVLTALSEAGIQARGVSRGLDHGAWVSLSAAFGTRGGGIGVGDEVPIVQVSLFDSDDPDQHYALGRALKGLRGEGVLLVASGMAVHNLRDFMAFLRGGGPKLRYAKEFDDALKKAAEQPAEKRQEALRLLMETPLARRAHPSFEHCLPMHIAAGAAGDDQGKQLWTMTEGGVSWAQYRFGEVQV